MSELDFPHVSEELSQKVAQARSRSEAIMARTLNVAVRCAENEDIVAATFARLAEERPAHARRLLAKGDAARKQAETERLFRRQEQASGLAAPIRFSHI